MKIKFKPTHLIRLDNGEAIPVELIDGAAYTKLEAETITPADYECDEAGNWTYQGQPFNGTVETIK